MSDIISARCFGCGNVIKVPAGLGGKKARCPQCTNTITIPMPNDTQHDEVIPDTELPEVARDDVPFEVEEGDAPMPPEEGEADPSESRRGKGTGVRRSNTSSSSYPRTVQRSGTQPRVGAQARAPQKSNTGMIVGIALGVLALIILGAVFAGGNSHSKAGGKTGTKDKEKERETSTKNQPQYSPDEQALISRLMDYTTTVNRADQNQILKFYTYDADDERKVRIRIAQELVDKKVSYENVKVTSVSAATGNISFTHGGGSKSLQWKQVSDVWLISELPSP